MIFKEGATVLGSGTLSSGQAQFTTSSLDAGTHAITAVYVGDTNFSISSDSGLTQSVNPASTATVLTSSAKSSVYGQTVTFTANVATVSPGGDPDRHGDLPGRDDRPGLRVAERRTGPVHHFVAGRRHPHDRRGL